MNEEFGRRAEDSLLTVDYSSMNDPNLKIVMVHLSYMSAKMNKMERMLEDQCCDCPETRSLWRVAKIAGLCLTVLFPLIATYLYNLGVRIDHIAMEVAKHTGNIVP